MKFDGVAYELGYWSARSGQPGLALSASMRVGYQHGAVDRALDSAEVTDTLRDGLRALSYAHESWRRGAHGSCRHSQNLADIHSREVSAVIVEREDLEVLQAVSPALYSRLKIAPGIQLVI